MTTPQQPTLEQPPRHPLLHQRHTTVLAHRMTRHHLKRPQPRTTMNVLNHCRNPTTTRLHQPTSLRPTCLTLSNLERIAYRQTHQDPLPDDALSEWLTTLPRNVNCPMNTSMIASVRCSLARRNHPSSSTHARHRRIGRAISNFSNFPERSGVEVYGAMGPIGWCYPRGCRGACGRRAGERSPRRRRLPLDLPATVALHAQRPIRTTMLHWIIGVTHCTSVTCASTGV
jgi:hypothetical protein